MKFAAFFIVTFMSLPALACNLSQFTLTSLTGAGPYTITTSLCYGHGFTGGASGGDPTGRFAFAFFGPSPLVINSFTPDSVTGPATGVGFKGDTIGPSSSPLSAQQNIVFTTTTAGGRLGCSNPPSCGGATQTCITFTFIMDSIPDSIRVFGIEASDSFTTGTGCNAESDMVIDFSSFLPVHWLGFMGEHLPSNKNLLVWTVAQEENCSHYIIRRSLVLNHHPEWKILGTIDCENRIETHQYKFIDNSPPPLGCYQIVQYDFNSENSKTRIISISNKAESLSPYPNPTNDYFLPNTKGVQKLEIVNSRGQLIAKKIVGSNTLVKINVSSFAPGVYIIKLAHANHTRIEKLIVENY